MLIIKLVIIFNTLQVIAMQLGSKSLNARVVTRLWRMLEVIFLSGFVFPIMVVILVHPLQKKILCRKKRKVWMVVMKRVVVVKLEYGVVVVWFYKRVMKTSSGLCL